jgi:hypothetical protein
MNEFCFAWIGQSEVGFGLGNGLQIFLAGGWGRILGATRFGRSKLPSGGGQRTLAGPRSKFRFGDEGHLSPLWLEAFENCL